MADRDRLDLSEAEWRVIEAAVRGITVDNRHFPMRRTPENSALIDTLLTKGLLEPHHTTHDGVRYEGYSTTTRAWKAWVEHRTPRCVNCGLRLRYSYKTKSWSSHWASFTTGKACRNPKKAP